MIKHLSLSILLLILISCVTTSLQAQIPRTLSYQGVFADSLGNPKPDATYTFGFSLFADSIGGTASWSEVKSVSVKRGLFSTILGDENPFPDSLKFDKQYWLAITCNYCGEMKPRIRLTSVGYSFNSFRADTAKYAITASQQSFVDSARIAGIVPNNSITSQKILDGTIQRGDVVPTFTAPYADTAEYARNTTSSTNLWQQTGSDIYYNSGNVGLGTSTPTAKLDINFGSTGSLKAGTPAGKGPGWIMLSASGHRRDLYGGNGGLTLEAGTTSAHPDNDQLFLSEAGNIGIRTFQPDTEATLDINTSNDNFGVMTRSEGTLGSEIGLHTGNAKYASIAKNAFFNSSGWNRFDIASGSFLQEIDPSGATIFKTTLAGSNPIAWNENLTLNPNGKVGIGVSNPISLLHIKGQNPTYLTIESGPGYASGTTLNVGGTNQWTMWCYPSDNRLAFFREGDGEKMVIKPNGFVGIGTESPSQLLNVYSNVNPRILVEATDAATPEYNLKRGSVYYNMYLNSVYDLCFFKDGNRVVFTHDGKVGVGTSTPEEMIHTTGNVKCAALILTGGGDIAEPFEINETTDILPGMIMTIDSEHPGKLKIAEKEYDKCVAGIVSGAGGINPGVLMAQEGSVVDGKYPIAMTGRVYCLADASNGRIEPGDLLTTSSTPGHAMKVTSCQQAQGSIIGKAMSELKDGKGLVLVLVSLQ